jgi:ribonuclease HI
LRLGDPHDNLSLTRRRRTRNLEANLNNDEILFDPSITCKENLAECFRIFTDPNTLSNIPAQRYYTHGITHRGRPVTIYTDGACINNGKLNAKCGSGIWFAPHDDRNRAIRVPGESQSNQTAEIVAILKAASSIPRFIPLTIISDSMYAINGLTIFLSTWENNGWIGIKNAKFFKKAAATLKQRIATTTFKWVKGHNSIQGNEEADRLAKEGADKPDPDIVDTTIPKEFDLQGAKLATISQSTAYKGILERKPPLLRRTTLTNLQTTREALASFHSDQETDKTIWNGLRNTAIRLKIRQFIYKALHGTQKVGDYWSHINGHETRRTCATCDDTESMDHILIHCREPPATTIWTLARQTWPHAPNLWPLPSLGIILGCGAIHLPADQPTNHLDMNTRPQSTGKRGIKRLLQILISESAHLIWVLRCERVIQEHRHTVPEIQARWFNMINKRLTEDRITATRIKRNKSYSSLVSSTWEPILSQDSDVPPHSNRFLNFEVLVGTRTLRPRP